MSKWLLGDARLPLEVAILLLIGLILLISGALLIPISSGQLRYYEDGLYGLLLVMVALQILVLGKTPFGDVRISAPVVAAGLIVTALGVTTCLVPNALGELPRALLFLFLGPGQLILLLQQILRRDRFRAWAGYGGVFRHLILASSLAYVLGMLFAVFIWTRSLVTSSLTAPVVLAYGAVIVYLAFTLRAIYTKYPHEDVPLGRTVELSADQSLRLILATFLTILGLLLIPISLGVIPFSQSAELGLLMVILAMQILTIGSTPVGPFPRSWLLVFLGICFAGPGVVSCVVPSVLDSSLTVLVGALNIATGVTNLARTVSSLPRRDRSHPQQLAPAMARLTATLMSSAVITIVFGIAMLVSNAIDTLVLGILLGVNGCLLMYSVHAQLALQRLQPQR